MRLAWGCVIAVSLFIAAPALAKSKLYILAIGVDQYADEFWHDLKYAASDAKAVTDALAKSSPYQTKITLLQNENVSIGNIKKFIDEVKRQARREDKVIVYLSGHGSLFRSGSGDYEKVFVLPDSKVGELAATSLHHNDLNSWVQSLPPKGRAVIYATCHSGIGKSKIPAAIKQLLAESKGDISLAELDKVSEGFVVLSAASKSETARESAKLNGDIYTHYFLKGLDLYDRNQDGGISLLEAHDYAKQKTYQFSQGRQRPTMLVEAIGEADFVLRGQKVGDPQMAVLEAYDAEFAGYRIETSGGEKGVLPIAVPIRNGEVVQLYSEGSEKIATYKVNASPGTTIKLAELVEPAPWAIGIVHVVRWFADGRFDRLNNEYSYDGQRLEINYTASFFTAGIFYDFPFSRAASPLTGIDTEISYASHGLFAGGRYEWDRQWAFTGNVRLTKMDLALKIKDTYNGDSRELTVPGKYAPVYELRAIMTLPSDPLRFYLSYARSMQQEYVFAELGSLSGERSYLGIGLELTFGGKGHKL